MDIFGVLALLGGLAIFLYGMDLLGEGLTGASGGKLENILEKLTSNPIKAVLLGAGVTAVIQSSSATTVMVVGFVNSGIMKLRQAIGIIMGANIGTTITSWILSLTGIESDNLFIRMLKPTSFSPILAVIGVVMLVFLKKDKFKNPAKIFIGFALLMLENILEKLTSNPIKAVLLGAGVTAVIQSSSATTVMVVGFVNSGIMKLRQAIGIIMGANIGTTITSWILSLTGIESDNLFIRMLKPTSFSPILAVIGVVMLVFLKKDKFKNPAKIFIGFALLMYGMEAMSSSVEPLAEVPQFQALLTTFKNPILGMIAGLVFTAIIQSSSASVGILQALCSTGILSYSTVLPIIMGQNIGTCATAMLSSIGASKNGKRAAIVHLYFNVIGTVVFMTVFYTVNMFVHFSFLNDTANEMGIAVIHTTFNIITTALLLPLRNVLEKLAYMTIRVDDEEKALMERQSVNEFALLDDRFLESPSLAVEHCKTVIGNMADISRESLFTALGLIGNYDENKALYVGELESRVDKYEDELGTYIMKISTKILNKDDSETLNMMLHSIGDFERISDHACNLCDSARELHNKQMEFSPKAKTELDILCSAVREVVDISFDSFKTNNIKEADKVEPLEELIDTLTVELKARHIRRLREGKCTIELGFAHSDILNNLERVSDHCSNIAVDVIQSDKENFDTHEYLDAMKNRDNQQFAREYKEYKEKYRLPETRKFV